MFDMSVLLIRKAKAKAYIRNTGMGIRGVTVIIVCVIRLSLSRDKHSQKMML